MALGYKDYEFHFWMIEADYDLPLNWEVTGRVEQILLEVSTNGNS